MTLQCRANRTGRMALSGSLCLLALLLPAGSPVQAGLTSLWRMDETAGTTVPNGVAGGTDGTLYNGAAWVVDNERGPVLSFDGSDDYAAAAWIPALAVGDNFTWSFWANSSQGANNNVIFGNRYDGANNSWIKFTTSNFEYMIGGSPMGINYADIPTSSWTFHTVVKNGSTLTYYRNGVAGGTSTVTAAMPTLPLRFGGDPTAERWQGRMDNAALFDHAIGATDVTYAMLGMYGRFAGLTSTNFSDAFDGTALDGAKWDVASKGLESNFAGGYDAPAVGGGLLTLGGTAKFQYWRGVSASSRTVFAVPRGGELQFAVDRVSLAGSGSGSRSSLWMYTDDVNYVHFSQNTEGNGGYAYNANNQNPTGSGVNLMRADSLDGNYGNHRMLLVNDGAFAKFFVNGLYLGSQAVTFTNRIGLLLTGQARAVNDTVAAVFDNVAATTRTYRQMYDRFDSGSIDSGKWTVLLKGLENQGVAGTLSATVPSGELVIQGGAGNQYWYGVTLQSVQTFLPRDTCTFIVDRDALDKGTSSAVRSSLWLWADDNHFLHFSQNLGENGWQYNYADGTRVTQSTGGGVNIAAFDALDNDPGRHEMQLRFARNTSGGIDIEIYLDGQLGATKSFANWGDREYRVMLSGMPRASGDRVYVAFDNMQTEVLATQGTVFIVR